MPPKKKTSAKKIKKPSKAPIKKTPTKKTVSQSQNVKQVVNVNVQTGSLSKPRKSTPRKIKSIQDIPTKELSKALVFGSQALREQQATPTHTNIDITKMLKLLEGGNHVVKKLPAQPRAPTLEDIDRERRRTLKAHDEFDKMFITDETRSEGQAPPSRMGTAFSMPQSEQAPLVAEWRSNGPIRQPRYNESESESKSESESNSVLSTDGTWGPELDYLASIAEGRQQSNAKPRRGVAVKGKKGFQKNNS